MSVQCAYCEEWTTFTGVDDHKVIDDKYVALCDARIARLPEEHATKSRDFGRGYSQAIYDVLTILRSRL